VVTPQDHQLYDLFQNILTIVQYIAMLMLVFSAMEWQAMVKDLLSHGGASPRKGWRLMAGGILLVIASSVVHISFDLILGESLMHKLWSVGVLAMFTVIAYPMWMLYPDAKKRNLL
jgi:hypothetical protein